MNCNANRKENTLKLFVTKFNKNSLFSCQMMISLKSTDEIRTKSLNRSEAKPTEHAVNNLNMNVWFVYQSYIQTCCVDFL